MPVNDTKSKNIRVREVQYEYEDFLFRAPLKFGGVAIDRCTLVNVHAVVEAAAGRVARGFGSMPLGNVWSFPSRTLTYHDYPNAMKTLVERLAQITGAYRDFGHHIDLTWVLEPAYLEAAREVTRQLNLAEPIPPLCTLVTASAVDAALHDAF